MNAPNTSVCPFCGREFSVGDPSAVRGASLMPPRGASTPLSPTTSESASAPTNPPVTGANALQFEIMHDDESDDASSPARRLRAALTSIAIALVSLAIYGGWSFFHYAIIGPNPIATIAVSVGVLLGIVVPIVVIAKRWLAFVVEDRGPKALGILGTALWAVCSLVFTAASYGLGMGANIATREPAVPVPCAVTIPRPGPMRGPVHDDAQRDVVCKMTDGTVLRGVIPNTREARVGALVLVPLRRGGMGVWMVEGPAISVIGSAEQGEPDPSAMQMGPTRYNGPE